MAGSIGNLAARATGRGARTNTEPRWVQWIIIGLGLMFLSILLILPLASVLVTALSKGPGASWEALRDADTIASIKLTLLTVLVSVPLNVLFGITAAWSIAKFDFIGKQLLITLIDLPFSVSPVISGIIFILLFGANGLLGPTLTEHGIRIIFAPPGIIIATMFVTFPFVARELIPLMQAQGRDDEEAAISLGASGLRTFLTVTIPNIKWGLLYGVILCNAKALGEFGAVSVVSGHIRGETNTVPLHVEILYNEYKPVAAFSVASILVILAVGTIVLKNLIEWKAARDFARIRAEQEAAAEAGAALQPVPAAE